MMKGLKVETRKTFEMVITLERSYAEWLLMYMQNPKRKDESLVDKDLREKLYQEINNSLR